MGIHRRGEDEGTSTCRIVLADSPKHLPASYLSVSAPSRRRASIFGIMHRSMATYVVGDVHGCFDSLRQLLKIIEFDSRQDRLRLVGDLVNRGPQSLELLRWAMSLGNRVVTVLGNHDLYLLARVLADIPPKRSDTLSAIMMAEDLDDLVAWLRRRPLAHFEENRLIVHAGVLPHWTLNRTLDRAREVEKALQGDQAAELLRRLSGRTSSAGCDSDPVCRATRVLTGIRLCTRQGEFFSGFTAGLSEIPEGYSPWFAFPDRRINSTQVIFGHWSTLGIYRGHGVQGLDSGCVHGGKLTALRVEDGTVFQSDCGNCTAK